MGLREEILGLDDRLCVEVEVPEWGGRVLRVAAMAAVDRDAWELAIAESAKAGHKLGNVRAGLVARCVVDERYARVFSEDDVEALGRKNAKALDRLYEAAARLNGLSAADREALEKN